MPSFTLLKRNALPVKVVPAGRCDCAATFLDPGFTATTSANNRPITDISARRRIRTSGVILCAARRSANAGPGARVRGCEGAMVQVREKKRTKTLAPSHRRTLEQEAPLAYYLPMPSAI